MDETKNPAGKLEPVLLTRDKEKTCKDIEKYYKDNKINEPPTKTLREIYAGGIHAMKLELRNTPDWMSQSAHSFRELLYPMYGFLGENTYKPPGARNSKMYTIYGKFCDLCHHGIYPQTLSKQELKNFSESDFESLVTEFEKLVPNFFIDPQDTPEYIKVWATKNPMEYKQDKLKDEIKKFHNKPITKGYFYSYVKTNREWFDWLWKNGFLEELTQTKEKPEYEDIGPIVGYLFRLVEKHPEKVVDTILATAISEKNLNQRLLEDFLRICQKLPPTQLARVIPKIEKEGWVVLLAKHNRWGLWYKDLLKTLYEAGDYENLLRLAKNILIIRKDRDGFQDIFYLEYLPETDVFNYLADINEDHLESALSLIAELVGKVITSRKSQRILKEREVFKFNEGHLSYIDIFKLDREQEELLRHTEVPRVIATMKALVDRLVTTNTSRPKDIVRIYDKYIEGLPDSQLSWRFKLYVMSRSPKILKNQFKDALFRLFKYGKNYYQILRGAEYLRALKVGFPELSEGDKRKYVKESLDLFSKEPQRDNQNVGYIDEYFDDGSHVFSMITDEITEAEKSIIEKGGFTLDPNFEPQPYVQEPKSEFIGPIKPIEQEDFAKLSIREITDRLHKEWSPQSLRTIDNDFRGRRLMGVEELLKTDIPTRLAEYIDNVHNFFNPPILDLHYTYSFLSGIEAAIKQQKDPSRNINWNRFIGFLIKIKRYYKSPPPPSEKQKFNGNWSRIAREIADIVKQLLAKKDQSPLNDIQPYRPQLLEIIEFLLSNPDPDPDDKGLTYQDPFTQALNSIRGKGFEVLMNFIYRESERFDQKAKVRIAADIKELFKDTIGKKRSRALMFMFGYFFPDIYYRDTKWAVGLLPKIFPRGEKEQPLYTAAWEGYLSNGNIYREVFFEDKIQKLYFRALDLKNKDYPKQKHFQDPNEAIAQHLALALLHYEKFDFEHDLFKKFWQKDKTKRQRAFIEFLGRHFVSGDEDYIKPLLGKETEIKEQLKEFWLWLLDKNKNPELFKEFGYWMNTKNKIFETKWLIKKIVETLKKTKGALIFGDWLEESIPEFVKKSPVDTAEIIDLYLSNKSNLWINDDIWFEALGILHKNKETHSKALRIIEKLISNNKNDAYLNSRLTQIVKNEK